MVLTVILALIGVLSLMGGLAYVLKYFQQKGRANKWWNNKYLKIVETLHIDQKHKLVVVSCVETNHLLLLGGQHDLLLQSNFPLTSSLESVKEEDKSHA